MSATSVCMGRRHLVNAYEALNSGKIWAKNCEEQVTPPSERARSCRARARHCLFAILAYSISVSTTSRFFR